MNLVPFIVEAVRQRGGAAVWAWMGLMLATWLVFAYGTDRPLKGTEVLGAGFVYGLLVIGVSALVSWLRKREPNPKSGPNPKPKKKRR